MTKIEAIELKINEMQIAFMEEVKDLQKALAELKESKKEGKWKPKDGEIYWYRNDIGATDFDEVCNTTAHDWQLKNLPIFKTKEECERYWHFMDTVKEKSYSFSKEEWEDRSMPKYYFYYVPISNGFVITYELSQKNFGGIYFKTRVDAQYIIDNFKDELMEYWI